ncbi:sulfotransferase [Pycnococcus provasolii]
MIGSGALERYHCNPGFPPWLCGPAYRGHSRFEEGLQLQLQDRRSEDNARTCHERCNSHNVPVVVEKYKLVFFTTPGVAHTEFEQLLRRMSPDTSDELTHIDAYPFETAYAVLRNDSWTKAIFFRSPVKRFVSGYTTKAKEDTDMDLSTFVDKVERGWYHPSEAYWKSQCEYVHLCDAILPFMNFVGDFGNLANDTRRLLERVSAWDTHGFDTEGGWGGSCTTFCGREHESLSNLSNDVLHRIERLLGADMRIIPQHIKAVAKKPTFPHVADPFVDAFYLYDNPEITMNNWTRICEKRSHADHLFVNALQHHPTRKTLERRNGRIDVIEVFSAQTWQRPRLVHISLAI